MHKNALQCILGKYEVILVTRKEAREQAFCLIFENQFKRDNIEEVLENAVLSRDLEDDKYISTVFAGTYENIEKIDELISNSAKGWSLSRISKTALAAMRLCVYEMIWCSDIPVSVSINEAIEIIKKFATAEDASFANGVLGTISKKIKNGENK